MTDQTISGWRAACEVPPAAKRVHRRAIILIEIWAFVWVCALVLLSKGTVGREIGVALAILSTAVGIGTVLVFVRFLGALDELQRKIQTDALALGFGLAAVTIVSHDLLARSGVDLFSSAGPVALVVMVLGYIVGVYRAAGRYA